MQIEILTGREWHTSNTVSGYVFVLGYINRWNWAQTLIHESDVASLVRREKPELIGNKGKHGVWYPSTYDVPAGTYLKFWSAHNKHTVQAIFKVSHSAPLSMWYGAVYGEQGAEITGQLEWVDPETFLDTGVVRLSNIHTFARDRMTRVV